MACYLSLWGPLLQPIDPTLYDIPPKKAEMNLREWQMKQKLRNEILETPSELVGSQISLIECDFEFKKSHWVWKFEKLKCKNNQNDGTCKCWGKSKTYKRANCTLSRIHWSGGVEKRGPEPTSQENQNCINFWCLGSNKTATIMCFFLNHIFIIKLDVRKKFL